MTFRYLGHACFRVETHGSRILFDPFISPNDLAKDIDVNSIEADHILVSHGHGDHVADLQAIATRTGAKVIGAAELTGWANKNGISNTHPMNTGGSYEFPFGKVKCTVAHHSSSMPDGSYAANPMGFIVSTAEKTFYYSGDTSLTLDMQLIPRWAKLDFAVLPIGDNFTMGYEDAALAAEFAGASKVIGVHYDTFGWIKIDHNAAIKAFRDKGIELLLPKVGESIVF